MTSEITFTKYKKRGAYHWQQISRSIFNFNAFVAARYQQIVLLIPKKKTQKILDIGCGDGVLAYLIYQHSKATITGLDYDKSSLEAAKKIFKAKKAKAKFISGSAYKLPFKTGSFDIVVSTEVIEHLSKTNKYLSEINRVVKSKGKVIITTPIKIYDIPEDKMHIQEFTSEELKKILMKYFKKVSIYTSHPLFLKKLYALSIFKLDRFYFEPFKWLINAWVLLTGINPFKLSIGKNTNQIAICSKPL